MNRSSKLLVLALVSLFVVVLVLVGDVSWTPAMRHAFKAGSFRAALFAFVSYIVWNPPRYPAYAEQRSNSRRR